MRLFFLFTFCLVSLVVMAQKQGPFRSADSITITGLVNNTVTLSFGALNSMPDTTFASLKILNHLGEYKAAYQHVKCIPLKNLFQKNLATTLKPKEMLSLYFVFKAMDGFTVVYSYNELFNAPAGGIFLLTAYDNYNMTNMPERPVLLATGDYKSAKLGMRGLTSIDVRMAK